MSLPAAPAGKVIFRIFTEDIPDYRHSVIRALRDHGFPYYTIVRGGGYGPDQSEAEDTLVIDVAVEDEDWSPAIDERIAAAAQKICEENGPPTEQRPEGGQGSVLVARIPASIQLVKRNREAGYKHVGGVLFPPEPSFWGSLRNRPRGGEPDYRGKILFESGEPRKLLKARFGLVRRGRVVGFFITGDEPQMRISFSASSH